MVGRDPFAPEQHDFRCGACGYHRTADSHQPRCPTCGHLLLS